MIIFFNLIVLQDRIGELFRPSAQVMTKKRWWLIDSEMPFRSTGHFDVFQLRLGSETFKLLC